MNKNKVNNSREIGKVATSNHIIWLPIKKVAELRGISVQAIRKSCSEKEGRYKDGQYKFRSISGNGGEQYEILLSSLPEPIQAKYWLEHHKPQQPGLPVVYENQENVQIEHDAYETIADSYSKNHLESKKKQYVE